MTRRILLDINIVLDVLLNRKQYVTTSGALWRASDRGEFEGHLAAFSLPTIYYICERQQSRAAAQEAVDRCLEAFAICALYRETALAARELTGPDFEDNLQISCAVTDFLHGIVTRDTAGFQSSPLKVFSPQELIAELSNR